jgi:sigma-B regulation protein RsbU (phosphoserine phosphatase)
MGSLENLNSSPRHLAARILVVDDLEFNLVLITDMLNHAGFHNIVHAKDGIEALEKVGSESIDLMILDIAMPRLDGFGVCKAMSERKSKKHIPVLVQTAIHDADERLNILSAGAHDLLTKPLNPKELLLRIHLHLDHAFSVNDLADYKSVMEEDLALAQRAQFALLPSADEIEYFNQKIGVNVASHYQPSIKVGGDLWGIKPITHSKVAFFAFDVAGHGVTAAIHAFQLHSLIDLALLLDLAPAEYLTEINSRASHIFKPGQFAVCLLGMIDLQSNKLSYTSSGFTTPIIFNATTRSARLLSNEGIPLGISDRIAYENHVADFGSNDSLLFYSDALIETPKQNDPQDMLSEADIIDCLKKHSIGQSLSCKEVLQDLARAIGADSTSQKLSDDLMMVLISRAQAA